MVIHTSGRDRGRDPGALSSLHGRSAPCACQAVTVQENDVIRMNLQAPTSLRSSLPLAFSLVPDWPREGADRNEIILGPWQGVTEKNEGGGASDSHKSYRSFST